MEAWQWGLFFAFVFAFAYGVSTGNLTDEE